MCFMVPSDDMDDVKSSVFPLIEMGVKTDGGRTTAESEWQEIKDGYSQLWMVVDEQLTGICVTAIINYPNLRSCKIRLCAGEKVKGWIHLLRDHVEPWAREKGCETMEGHMRKGWQRLMPDYSTTRIFMEKRL